MRRLFPDPADDVDLTAAYAADVNRWVRVNFVSSVDGAVTLSGRSGGLSSPADKQIFNLLRTLSDVVLVGAGTVRAENYGGADPGNDRTPPFAVVTRSLDLDPQARLFTAPAVPPILVTCAAAPEDRRERLSQLAEVVVAGDDDVDVRQALDTLADRGYGRVVCEGGPHLFGWMLAADAVDELCLTLAPTIAGGTAGRIVAGLDTEIAMAMRLVHVLEDDGHLFLRYLRPAG